MDGVTRVSVDTYVMEYIMHCMYNTFLKIQKGLHVAVSWHRDDDTVLITSTSRSSPKHLHQALNRFFVLYHTVKQHLTFDYCRIHGTTHNHLYISNQIAEKFRRIYVQKTASKHEIKIWGFRSEIEQVLRFVKRISGDYSSRLETPYTEYSSQSRKSTYRTPKRLEKLESFLPRVQREENGTAENKTWIHEPTMFEYQLKESLRDVLDNREPSDIVYSKSFEKKLSSLKPDFDPTRRKPNAPSRFSTTEIRRIQEHIKSKEKISAFPKVRSAQRPNFQLMTEGFQSQQILTPTGLKISCIMHDEIFEDPGQVLVAQMSSTGKLSDQTSWMIAKYKAYEITRIIRLHISLYGALNPSKVIVTPGFQLPYQHVIHSFPPPWDEENVKKSLKQLLSTYRNIFRVADADVKAEKLLIPVLGRCPQAGNEFPELVALSLLNQAIVSCTKFGLRTLHHIQIVCSRQSELEYVKTKLFAQVLALKYNPRYLEQQRSNFLARKD